MTNGDLHKLMDISRQLDMFAKQTRDEKAIFTAIREYLSYPIHERNTVVSQLDLDQGAINQFLFNYLRSPSIVLGASPIEVNDIKQGDDRQPVVKRPGNTPIHPIAEGGLSLSPQDVKGSDDRLTIPYVQHPYSSICRLIWEGQGFVKYGTAWVIADRVLATAAHNLTEAGTYAEPEDVALYFDQAGGEPLRVDKLEINQFWKDTGFAVADFALLSCEQLETTLEGTYLPIEMSLLSDYYLNGWQFEISGYPTEYFRMTNDEQLWHQGALTSFTDNMLYYQIDTSHGQSGAPIFYYDENGRCHSIGVHIEGPNFKNNEGLRFKDFHRNFLESYLSEH